jgi:ASC-1-like (ASCH) protein
MSLFERPFNLIQERKKTIKIRCNDEKRRKLRLGDTITFRKLPSLDESLTVRIIGLYPFKTFMELYGSFDFSEFGCEGYSMQQMLTGTRKIYDEEKKNQCGALGIRIKLIGSLSANP